MNNNRVGSTGLITSTGVPSARLMVTMYGRNKSLFRIDGGISQVLLSAASRRSRHTAFNVSMTSRGAKSAFAVRRPRKIIGISDRSIGDSLHFPFFTQLSPVHK